MTRQQIAWAIGCVLLLGGCTDGGASTRSGVTTPAPVAVEATENPCDVRSPSVPRMVAATPESEISRSSPLRSSALPRVLPPPDEIVAGATNLLTDPPGRVRMVAFWGNPGVQEPGLDTPVTFLGVDGAWRTLTVRDLGGESWYLSAGRETLSPDGSRWITNFDDRNVMVDLETGDVRDLSPARLSSAAWAQDSSSLALWSSTDSGITIFDKRGIQTDVVPVDVGKRQVFLLSDNRVTLAETVGGEVPSLRLVSTSFNGTTVRTQTCALPEGYRFRDIGVRAFDGRRVLLSALVDRRRFVYRFTLMDLATGEVIEDFEHRGDVPQIASRSASGLYLTDISGGPNAIYGIDPRNGDMTPLSRIYPYRDQAGYENHAASQFAPDLIFSR